MARRNLYAFVSLLSLGVISLVMKYNNFIFSSGSSNPCGPDDWRYNLPAVMRDEQLPYQGDIYEFGVFNGGSMRLLRKFFPRANMWGFDSFEGLPEELSDYEQTGFWPGNFRPWTSSFSVPKLIRELGGSDRAGIIVGFYNVSLRKVLREVYRMSPAMYIDIDADLYTGSLQALTWAFSSGLVRKGTLIGYDDWWASPCSKGGEQLHPLDTGEGKAHKEVAQAFRVKFRCVYGPCMIRASKSTDIWKCPSWFGVIFIVEALGGTTTPDHGVHMREEDIAFFKGQNRNCRSLHGSPWHKVIMNESERKTV